MKNSMEQKKLKPVILFRSRYPLHRQDDLQQKLLLRALTETQDPEELKKMIGVKTKADVFRLLDKISIRKEYHKALAKNGLDFDFIVSGIKDICVNAKKEDVKLKGYQTLMRSLGVGDYKDIGEESNGNWEDALIKYIEQEKKEKEQKVIEGKKPEVVEIEEYEVEIPEIPKEEQETRDKENEIGRKLYE